VKEGLKFHNTS